MKFLKFLAIFRIWRLKEIFVCVRGAIALEMSVIFGLLTLILVLSFDVGSALISKIKLERMAYSLAGVVRERAALYEGRGLSAQDADEIYELSKVLAKDSINFPFTIAIEELVFPGADPKSRGRGVAKLFSRGGKCEPIEPISVHENIAFYTNFDRWTNLYQISLCGETRTLFAPVFEAIAPRASAVVFAR